jgi:Uncharacterized protein conserved in bacteria (DUF2252)
LEAHAEFRPARSRDPVALLLGQAKARVPELVPIRHGRMLVSPFAFYRGAALVMAADLHTTPSSNLRVQLCGDPARKLKERKAGIKVTDKLLAKARTRNSLQAVGKLTTVTDGRRRIISDPPLVVPIGELSEFDHEALLERIRRLLAAYRDTLPPDRRWLLDQFTLADVAHKVVGVGSVGTRAWIFLFDGGVEGQASVLAGSAGASEYANQGERVGPPSMEVYARLCGWTLARAHARSGDRIAISAYRRAHVDAKGRRPGPVTGQGGPARSGAGGRLRLRPRNSATTSSPRRTVTS